MRNELPCRSIDDSEGMRLTLTSADAVGWARKLGPSSVPPASTRPSAPKRSSKTRASSRKFGTKYSTVTPGLRGEGPPPTEERDGGAHKVQRRTDPRRQGSRCESGAVAPL